MQNQLIKEHYKMYKAGKQWFFAAVASFAIMAAIGGGEATSIYHDVFHLAPITEMLSVNADNSSDNGTNSAGFNNGYQTYSDPSAITFANKREATIGKWVNIGPMNQFVANDAKSQWVNFGIVQAYAREDSNGTPYITIAIGTTQLAGQSKGTRNSFYGYASNGSTKTFQYQYPLQDQWAYIPTTDLDTSYNQVGLQFTANSNMPGSDGNKHQQLMTAKVQTQTTDSLNGDINNGQAKVKAAQDETNKMMNLLKAEQTKIDNAIDSDPTLTTAEKNTQKALIPPMLTEAQGKMDYEIDTATIDSIEQSYIPKIDGAHTAGVDLDKQKAAAQKIVDDKANAQVAAIKANIDMTDAEKTAAEKKVTDAQSTMDSNINSAADADHVNSFRDDATQNGIIDNANKAEMTLAARQAAAIAQLEADKKSAEDQIAKDPTLTSSEKEQRKNNIDNAVSTAETAINGAKKAQDVVDALGTAETTINNNKTSGTPIAQQQNTAKQSVADYGEELKKKIAADNTLTQTEKDNQTKAVNQAIADIQKEIDDATTADDINKYRDTKKSMDSLYVPGTDLDTQKKNAKDAVDGKANQKLSDIANNNDMTDAEKSAAEGKVKEAQKTMDDAIASATDADGVNNARDDQTQNGIIDNANQASESLQDRIKNAISQLDTDKKNAEDEIDKDATLTASEKKTRKDNLDQAIAKAEQNITDSKTAQSVVDLLNGAEKTISDSQAHGTDLNTQKQNAKDAVDEAAAAIKSKIDGDNGLTSDEKKKQEDKLEEDRKAADTQIDNAKDADGVNDDKNAGIGTVDSDYTAATSTVDQQKAAAKQAIDDEVAKVKKGIQEDNSLTGDEKKAQSDKVDQDKQAAYDNIDKAQNADGVNDARNAGIKAIDGDHIPEKPLPDQKNDQKGNLADEANKIINDIKNDNTLTQPEKDKQIQQVKDDLQAADDNIDKAQSREDVIKAASAGKITIDDAHVPGASLDNQRSAAKKLIDDEAAKIKKDIQDDNSLTGDEKANQEAAAETARQQADADIDKQSSADAINSSGKAGIKNVDDTHVPGASLDNQRSAAKKLIDDEAAKIKKDIQDDNSLTGDEKANQEAAAETARQQADADIDKQSSADAINSSEKAGIKNVDDTHVPGTNLGDQKTAQKAKVDAEAAKVIADINADKTLPQTTKDSQIAKVNADKTAADNVIDQAVDADGVSAAYKTGIGKIDSEHVPGTAVNTQKTNAKNKVDAEAAKVINDINNDSSLSTDEKNAQIAKVNADKSTADQNIDNATDSDDITNAYNTGVKAIDADHKSDKSIPDQKKDARGNLQEEANKIINQIKADNRLTDAEKSDQIKQVNADLAAADTAIDQAADGQGITEAMSNGKATLDADYHPGQSLDNQKGTAKGNLDAEAQKIINEIKADSNLTSGEKQTDIDNVNRDKQLAENKIDAANSAQDIQDALNTGKSQIDKDYTPGVPAAEHKGN
ncbi:DUF1542 domain-containing protein [Fructobacillus sp. M158]|uniref:DUF1542 domain-containing protein n=1 Tax=Fructobacillus parabroussonetiae TaxID=2713174 RepID=UPI00200A00E3|nr:DUF1542 domain-containing protein [Fructobacillus parabroussonetiae]MCK8617186.1 DUF1542 domain-containing protein [Fructobacillus parabroussonetiae]